MKNAWTKIKDWYNKFNDWVASWMPGLKTLIITALGSIGSMAAVLQEYVTGLPLDQMVGPTKALMATALLFTLGFWFKMISNRA